MQHCPKCNSNSAVIDSRLHRKSDTTYRRRKCLKCDARWSTVEIPLARATQLDRAVAALAQLRKMLAMIAPTTTAL